MGFERIISFFMGYVEILIRGPHLEKFINLATNSGLYLWDARRLGPETLYAKIRVHGFLRIRELARKAGATVKIRGKNGWPFLWRKLSNRKFFAIGAIFFVIILFFLSSFIFFIKVEGFEGEERRQLIASLAKLGLKPGVARSEVLHKKSLIEKEVMIETPNAVWLGIRIQGVVAEVKVIRRQAVPVAAKNNDIIAGKSGLISKLIVVRGVPAVQEGDTVSRGDLLISGTVWHGNPESGDLIKEEVPAKGIVEARVWYDITVLEPRIIWKPVFTAKKRIEYKLRYGRSLWHLGSFGKKTKGNYSLVRWRKRLYQGRNPMNNVEFIKDILQPVSWRRMVVPTVQLKRDALAEANRKAKFLGGLKIRRKVASWTDEKGFLRLDLTVETVQDIAMIKLRGKEP